MNFSTLSNTEFHPSHAFNASHNEGGGLDLGSGNVPTGNNIHIGPTYSSSNSFTGNGPEEYVDKSFGLISFDLSFKNIQHSQTLGKGKKI